MPDRAHITFHDDELRATIPGAFAVYHIDDARAAWSPGWTGKKVDWVWCEADHLFLCELKDPESAGAIAHSPLSSASSHVQGVLDKLAQAGFDNEFATKAHDTIHNHPPARAAARRSFIVAAAISDPLFDVVAQQTAA